MRRIVDCGHFLTAVACGGWLWQSLPGRAYSFLDIFLATTYPRSCPIWWPKNQFTWGLVTAAKSLSLCYLPRGQLVPKTGPQLEVGWRLQRTSVMRGRNLGDCPWNFLPHSKVCSGPGTIPKTLWTESLWRWPTESHYCVGSLSQTPGCLLLSLLWCSVLCCDTKRLF